tara:strand:- start:641 stop:1402 length:762 start_codon:yes stop_codon:yes gene_type:complete
MQQFGDLYSQYYDLLYQDKDYQHEVDYVDRLIIDTGKSVKTILDIGCGTGKHAEMFCNKGYKVHGIDISEDMLKIAKKRCSGKEDELSFSHSSVQNLMLEKRFDAIISLFHVMSYQSINEDLIKTFKVVKSHLNDGGIFIFDFWYGPAVLTDLPVVRNKKFDNDRVKVTRMANPSLNAQNNTVNVDFDIFIENKNDGQIINKQESHKMRYFFDFELEMISKNVGLSIEKKYKWMSDNSPDFESWYAVWVLKAS